VRQDLTEYELELLGILQEECAEVIQIISKIRRFGLNDFHPEDPNQVSNKAKLTQEIGDIVCVVELLMQRDLLEVVDVDLAAERKHEKLKRFLRNQP
jgi:NTP pyrophosphatase (non-canonical NTP hydrolase)